MRLNADKSSDPLRLLFWRNMLITILICLVASVTVGICKSSLAVGILTYFLLSFMLMVLVVFKQYQTTAQEYENC